MQPFPIVLGLWLFSTLTASRLVQISSTRYTDFSSILKSGYLKMTPSLCHFLILSIKIKFLNLIKTCYCFLVLQGEEIGFHLGSFIKQN